MVERKNKKKGGPSSSVGPMATRGRGRGAIALVEDWPSPMVLGRRSEEESIEEASRSALMDSLESRFSDLVKSVSDMDGDGLDDSGLKKALNAVPINLEVVLNNAFEEVVVEDLGSGEDSDSDVVAEARVTSRKIITTNLPRFRVCMW